MEIGWSEVGSGARMRGEWRTEGKVITSLTRMWRRSKGSRRREGFPKKR